MHFDISSEEEHDDAISAGTIIADRYRVRSPLGAGGMGTVYLAEHLTVGRQVAIKVLSGEWSGQSFVARRFQAEARIASTIGHPNIVEVFDAGQLPDGRLFLVMEHLEGHDLAAEIDEQGSLSQLRTAQVLRQVALALEAAHGLGVIHRDLKPGNVMIAWRASGEVVKILDFGVACSPSATAKDGQRLTLPGSVMGTPDYMAPEQSTPTEPTPRFDLYALGVMAFEMLTGELPIVADDAYEVLVRKRQVPAPSLATRVLGADPGFVALVDDCLQISPSARPRDMRAFIDRLDAVLDALPADDFADEPLPAAPTAPLLRAASSEPHSVLIPPALPAVPTLSVRPGPADTSRWLWLSLLLVVLALGAWLVQTPSQEATQLALPGDAAPPERIDPPALTPSSERVDPPALAPEPPLAADIADIADDASDATDAVPEAPPAAIAGSTRPTNAARPAARAFATSECLRVRARADEARRTQSWSLLRQLSSQRRSCWPTDAEARKLQTKALMELGDFSGCLTASQGLADKDVQQWRKLCQRRAG